MNEGKKPEQKKTLNQTLFFVILGALFLLMLFHDLLVVKTAKVSFSYQLEHLVNLDLLQPEELRKTATLSNLVSFSGKFRDSKTEIGRQRFRFLELIEEQNQLSREFSLLEEEMQQGRKKVVNAATLFLGVSGIKVPSTGYTVFSEFFDTSDRQNHIIIRDVPDRASPTFLELKEAFDGAGSAREANSDYYLRSLAGVLASFRSPLLGVGNEGMKKTLREIDSDIQQALLPATTIQTRLTTAQKAFSSLSTIITSLDQVEDYVRLKALRSTRDYSKWLDQYALLTKKLEETHLRLERAMQPVSDQVWFFNNEEVSSRLLEKQESEAFHQWFVSAKEEWSQFDVNKEASFKAPDQPLNKVLEKTFKSEELSANYIGYLFSLAPIFLVLFLLYVAFFRQMKGGMGGNPMDFSRSPARLYPKGSNPVTFKDVAGIDDALEELQEIVEFLKSPQKFTSLGGKIPKGVLCIGPPGTGKTLIARAVAGEADCPFFSISGSDFVEMFVGVGASRVRDMFVQAKEHAPCIIFIDEIDAVGRHRGAGIGGGHDEREQTLNQLLVEMDGFDTTEGIIIVAATNRPDVLDKALLRPGRFDRQVIISLPDIKGRFEILKVHARKIKMDEAADLMVLAKSTPGSSGADLSNMLNEAALLAARKGREAVTMQEIYEARDKVLYGKERKNLELDLQEKRSTAYHESGHAVVGSLVEHVDPIDKVTIIPRGFSLGATQFLPKKNRLTYWRKELVDELAVLMGGRAAEEIFIHDISNGAKQDLERATQIARSMVCEWGMSEALGTVTYDERTENGHYLGVIGYREKTYSDVTAQAIDHEVRHLLDEAYASAKKLISEHQELVELMMNMLLEFETLDAEDIQSIVKGTWNVEEKRSKQKAILEKGKKVPPLPPKEALEDKTPAPTAPTIS